MAFMTDVSRYLELLYTAFLISTRLIRYAIAAKGKKVISEKTTRAIIADRGAGQVINNGIAMLKK